MVDIRAAAADVTVGAVVTASCNEDDAEWINDTLL